MRTSRLKGEGGGEKEENKYIPSQGSGSVLLAKSSIENLTSTPFSIRDSGSAFMSQYCRPVVVVLETGSSSVLPLGFAPAANGFDLVFLVCGCFFSCLLFPVLLFLLVVLLLAFCWASSSCFWAAATGWLLDLLVTAVGFFFFVLVLSVAGGGAAAAAVVVVLCRVDRLSGGSSSGCWLGVFLFGMIVFSLSHMCVYLFGR